MFSITKCWELRILYYLIALNNYCHFATVGLWGLNYNIAD